MIRFVCSVRPFSVTLPFPGEDHGRTPVGPELNGGVQIVSRPPDHRLQRADSPATRQAIVLARGRLFVGVKRSANEWGLPLERGPAPRMTDLVQHVDDWVGFALRRPPGWEVRVTNGIISVVQDPSGLVNAIIWPLLLPQPLPPLEIARQLISLWSSGKRTVRAWRAGDEPLVLRTEFQQGDRLLTGL